MGLDSSKFFQTPMLFRFLGGCWIFPAFFLNRHLLCLGVPRGSFWGSGWICFFSPALEFPGPNPPQPVQRQFFPFSSKFDLRGWSAGTKPYFFSHFKTKGLLWHTPPFRSCFSSTIFSFLTLSARPGLPPPTRTFFSVR